MINHLSRRREFQFQILQMAFGCFLRLEPGRGGEAVRPRGNMWRHVVGVVWRGVAVLGAYRFFRGLFRALWPAHSQCSDLGSVLRDLKQFFWPNVEPPPPPPREESEGAL